MEDVICKMDDGVTYTKYYLLCYYAPSSMD
jgi:hypothetical protein